MADNTAIEWTDATWNPVRARNTATGAVGWHCVHVSEGCRNCYAETINRRLGTKLDFKPAMLTTGQTELFLDEDMLRRPLHWRRPREIFAGSMTDLFADFVPDPWLDRIFAIAALSPQHTFQFLTKRPDRMRRYMTDSEDQAPFQRRARLIWDRAFDLARNEDHFKDAINAAGMTQMGVYVWPLPNVWMGTSVEDQPTAEARVTELAETPAAVRFISYEPALGPVDFTSLPGFDRIHQVIYGGESGPDARPHHPNWARDALEACASQGAAFLFKQWGAWKALDSNDGEWPTDSGSFIRLDFNGLRADQGWPLQRVGKKFAGRLLDGIEHNGRPAEIEARHVA